MYVRTNYIGLVKLCFVISVTHTCSTQLFNKTEQYNLYTLVTMYYTNDIFCLTNHFKHNSLFTNFNLASNITWVRGHGQCIDPVL